MGPLRLQRVRGRYHQLLRDVLRRGAAAKVYTQDSMAEDLDIDQTTVGKYLSEKGGTLDLDDANAALMHIGSSLQAFVADPEHIVPVAPTLPVVVRRLLKDDGFVELVGVLAGAKVDRRPDVVRHLVSIARALTPKRRGGRPGGYGQGGSSTTRKPRKRR